MKVVFGTTVLCAGIAAEENMEDWSKTFTPLNQVRRFLRAPLAKSTNRGNGTTTVSFKITRQHADARTCEEFILTHAGSIPLTGKVVFTAEGGGSTVKTLSDATLDSVKDSQIGVASIHTYQFTGGDFS